MVLSLEAYASRGGEDIYVSFYENGIWSQPQNVGSDINTPLQEMTPFISADHNTLYFSSNGHGGAGGRDLFMVTRQDDTWRSWSAPVPVVGDINSNGVELSYWIDYLNEIAYYTTTQNSDGYGDIRAAKITGAEIEEMEEELFEELVAPEEEAVAEATPKEQVFRGLVINAKDERPIAAAVHVRGTDLDKNMGTDGTIGTFEVSVPMETEELFISVKAPGYMGIEERVGLSGSGLNEATFALNPLEVGATIQLNKVYFERGKAILIDSSYAELDRLTDMLMENPEVKIELAGHTDNQGSSKLNLQLSKDRVEVVVDYLVDKGIDAKRIRGKGYGGTRPVASNASEATRRLNRRVEFTILKK
jgi:outer membrane protein OmpA-like peptidoglycan-associated protein